MLAIRLLAHITALIVVFLPLLAPLPKPSKIWVTLHCRDESFYFPRLAYQLRRLHFIFLLLSFFLLLSIHILPQ